MKIIAKKLNKNLIVVQLENLDDLWTLYNVLVVGDSLEGKTSRRVVVTDRDDDKGERKWIFLKIKIEQIEFHEFSNRLRAKGKIIEGPEDIVTLHTYHTFNIEENTKVGIIKDEWTTYLIEALEDAAKRKTPQKVLAVAIYLGEATFGEIGDYYQKTSMEVTENIPGKRYGNLKDSTNARNAFFADVLKTIEQALTMTQYSKIIIAGPGFTREHFMEYAINKNPSLKPMLLTEAVSSATTSGLRELLRKKPVQSILKDARIIEESDAVDAFFAELGKESGLAIYGIAEIKKAADMGAIEKLIITDQVMRRVNVEKDSKVLDLLRQVETLRGKIMIISTLHDAGRQVQGIGGIVAILRFKTDYS